MQVRKKRIGKYLIFLNEKLGAGSFSQVFKGVDQGTNQEVAIKVTSKQIIQEDEYTKNAFYSEIQIMKQLKSSNIIRFLDVHETKHNYYIVQQFANSGTFRELMNSAPHKRFTQPQALIFMTQILNGFGQLVKNGIIHRDIKPQNILVKNNYLKIADFGFAKQSDNNSFMRTILGSPLYMSPQLLKQIPYSYKCDIWALGVIFYEMVVGTPPWDFFKDRRRPLDVITDTAITFPSSIGLSQGIKQLIIGCLGYEQDQRYEWEQIYLHPLFAQKFKQNFVGDKKNSIKLAFLISDIRMQIHSQNIDMPRHINRMNQSDIIDYQGFTRIFLGIDNSLQTVKINLLFKNCCTKCNSNNELIPKNLFIQYLRANGIRMASIIPQQSIVNQPDAAVLIKRLHSKLQKQKIDIYQLYRIEDKQKKNALQIAEFGAMIKKMDQQLVENEIEILFKQFDLNADGKISFNEFYRTMCKIAGIANQQR